MRRLSILLPVVVVFSLVMLGCSSSDPTASDEYEALEQELAQTSQELAQAEKQLAEFDAEQDAPATQAATTTERYSKASATQAKLIAIIDDPSSFGTEEEALDLLDELAVPLVRYEDTAWPLLRPVQEGDWRTSWRNTIFNELPSTVTTWRTWLSEDGSTGGSLFTWQGTTLTGEPFWLPGIELSEFDEEGLYTETIMYYPYTRPEVWGIVGWQGQ
jgi:outer membrane murein-binding lipoprotein Lpp